MDCVGSLGLAIRLILLCVCLNIYSMLLYALCGAPSQFRDDELG